MKKDLAAIVGPYDNWFVTETDPRNPHAKAALAEFLSALRKTVPSKEERAQPAGGFTLSYLQNLNEIRLALRRHQYFRACNEVRTLMYQYPYLQDNIRTNLIYVLSAELSDDNA